MRGIRHRLLRTLALYSVILLLVGLVRTTVLAHDQDLLVQRTVHAMSSLDRRYVADVSVTTSAGVLTAPGEDDVHSGPLITERRLYCLQRYLSRHGGTVTLTSDLTEQDLPETSCDTLTPPVRITGLHYRDATARADYATHAAVMDTLRPKMAQLLTCEGTDPPDLSFPGNPEMNRLTDQVNDDRVRSDFEELLGSAVAAQLRQAQARYDRLAPALQPLFPAPVVNDP